MMPAFLDKYETGHINKAWQLTSQLEVNCMHLTNHTPPFPHNPLPHPHLSPPRYTTSWLTLCMLCRKFVPRFVFFRHNQDLHDTPCQAIGIWHPWWNVFWLVDLLSTHFKTIVPPISARLITGPTPTTWLVISWRPWSINTATEYRMCTDTYLQQTHDINV